MTTTELITKLQLAGAFPDDGYFTTANYLSFLNDAQQTEITPLLVKMNEEYLLAHTDFPIVVGSKYQIPTRAVGANLRAVKIVESDGSFRNLNRLFIEDKRNKLTGYYINRNSVELSDDIESGTLRLYYISALPSLVETSNCGQIVSINTINFAIEVSSFPNNSTFTNDGLLDFIQATAPYDLLAISQPISTIVGSDIIMQQALPETLAVGDYVCTVKQTCIPLIPDELIPLLIQAALVNALRSKKDKAAEAEDKKLQMMKQTMLDMLDPRVKAPDIKIRGQGVLNRMRFR